MTMSYATAQSYLELENSYQQERVEQASPLELTCLLYEGAIQAIEQAEIFLRRGEILARGRAITRAQGIVAELNSALDRSKGGELAARLGLLYDYALAKLVEAHTNQDGEALSEVRCLLKELHEGWVQICPPRTVSASSGAEAGYRVDLAG
jgi:flagellar protein FliS